MLILWRADFDGDTKQLERVNAKFQETAKKYGFRYEGPYYPQDASLLYLIHGTVEQMNQSGREFLPWAAKEGIPITPVRYEIAVSPQEFWGPGGPP